MHGVGDSLEHLLGNLPGDLTVVVGEDEAAAGGRLADGVLHRALRVRRRPPPHRDAVEVAEHREAAPTRRLDRGKVLLGAHSHDGGSGAGEIVDDRKAATRGEMGGSRPLDASEGPLGHHVAGPKVELARHDRRRGHGVEVADGSGAGLELCVRLRDAELLVDAHQRLEAVRLLVDEDEVLLEPHLHDGERER